MAKPKVTYSRTNYSRAESQYTTRHPSKGSSTKIGGSTSKSGSVKPTSMKGSK